MKRGIDFRIVKRDRECYWFLRPAISAFGIIDDVDEFVNGEGESLLTVLCLMLIDESQRLFVNDFFEFLDQSGRLDSGTHVGGMEDACDFDEVLEALGNASDGLVCSTFEIVESVLGVCKAVFCDEPVGQFSSDGLERSVLGKFTDILKGFSREEGRDSC